MNKCVAVIILILFFSLPLIAAVDHMKSDTEFFRNVFEVDVGGTGLQKLTRLYVKDRLDDSGKPVEEKKDPHEYCGMSAASPDETVSFKPRLEPYKKGTILETYEAAMSAGKNKNLPQLSSNVYLIERAKLLYSRSQEKGADPAPICDFWKVSMPLSTSGISGWVKKWEAVNNLAGDSPPIRACVNPFVSMDKMDKYEKRLKELTTDVLSKQAFTKWKRKGKGWCYKDQGLIQCQSKRGGNLLVKCSEKGRRITCKNSKGKPHVFHGCSLIKVDENSSHGTCSGKFDEKKDHLADTKEVKKLVGILERRTKSNARTYKHDKGKLEGELERNRKKLLGELEDFAKAAKLDAAHLLTGTRDFEEMLSKKDYATAESDLSITMLIIKDVVDLEGDDTIEKTIRDKLGEKNYQKYKKVKRRLKNYYKTKKKIVKLDSERFIDIRHTRKALQQLKVLAAFRAMMAKGTCDELQVLARMLSCEYPQRELEYVGDRI